MMMEGWCDAVPGFEDGRRSLSSPLKKEPEAKECRWTLEAGTGKGAASPLKPSQGTQPCQHRFQLHEIRF